MEWVDIEENGFPEPDQQVEVKVEGIYTTASIIRAYGMTMWKRWDGALLAGVTHWRPIEG